MGQPVSPAVRGGSQEGFRGVDAPVEPSQEAPPGEPEQEPLGNEPIMGYGELLEADPATLFQAVHNLVLRQEWLAINRLEQDTHWARVRGGYPFSRLVQNQDQSSWQAVLPPGMSGLTIAAVPNKALDLCNKAVETLMADPPKPLPKPVNDSEEAERAAEMAKRWLEMDGTEAGTNDNSVFFRALDAATYRSSSFLEYWVDKNGGGYVPYQIKAHPQAQDPQHPLVGPDGNPTTDPILRYVTAAQPDTGVRQFTNDPAKAEQVWQPKIVVDTCYREHIRLYPEDQDVHGAEGYIRLGYCTLGDAKKRWKAVADLPEGDQVALLDWTPTRYLVLLPAALRARWKLGLGSEKNEAGGSNDERYVFWYRYCRKACPDYPRGFSVYVSGALGGFCFDRDTLSAEVEIPRSALEGEPGAGKPKAKDLREMDLPIVQVRLIQDTEFRDPTGWPLIGRIAGSSEVKAQIVASYAAMMDRMLNPATYTPATSPVQAFQVTNSRASGDHIPILSKEDIPTWEPQPEVPSGVLNFMTYLDSAMDSAASSSKAAQGANDQQEVSGVARQIAVHQANISMSRFNQAHLEAYSRHCRVKVQLAMAYYGAPQLIRYVGEDGAYKQEWWTGADFALVSDVGIQPGTGTMQTPQEKVNFAFTATQMKFLRAEDAEDIVRSAISTALGAPDDPHQQRIERQVSTFLEGPPQTMVPDPVTGQAVNQWIMAKRQQLQIVQQNAQATQAFQQQAQAAAMQGMPVQGGPVLTPVPNVWSPFADRATDQDPAVAGMRKRRLGKLIDTARFESFPAEWRQDAIEAYQRADKVLAMAARPPMPALPPGAPQGPPKPPQPQSPQGAPHPATLKPMSPT